MASTARQKLVGPMAITAVVALCLVAQSHGRFLVEQKGLLIDSPGSMDADDNGSEGFKAEQQADSVPFTGFGSSIANLPFQWFQQQLKIFDALENAVIESLKQQNNADSSTFDNDNVPSQQEQLRKVGCTRLRDALLNKAAQDQAPGRADGDFSDSDSSAADIDMMMTDMMSSLGSNMMGRASAATDGDEEGNSNEDESSSDTEYYQFEQELEEYYEDYSGYSFGYDEYEEEEEVYTEEEVYADNLDADAFLPAGRVLRLLEGQFTPADGEEVDDAATDDQKYDAAAVSALSESLVSLLEKSALPASEDDPYEYELYDDIEEEDSRVETAALADLNEDVVYGDLDVYTEYGYDHYDDYEAIMTLTDAMLANFGIDSDDTDTDDEWADYLEQAYEYFTVYMQDDEYDSYTDVYIGDAPDAVAVLATIAELVIWSRMGNFVLEVRPGYSIVQPVGDGPDDGVGPMLLISDGMYGPALMEIHTLQPATASSDAAPVEVVDDLYLHLVYPDGSVNWGLVSLGILAACTVAMMVGFFISWVSLQRSMRCRYVYVPQRPGKRVGCSVYGKGCDSSDDDLSKALVLKPEECWGAVTVEDASQYVPPVVSNDSVAKALCK